MWAWLAKLIAAIFNRAGRNEQEATDAETVSQAAQQARTIEGRDDALGDDALRERLQRPGPTPIVKADAICAAIAPHRFTAAAIAGMDHADLVWANTINDYLAAHCK